MPYDQLNCLRGDLTILYHDLDVLVLYSRETTANGYGKKFSGQCAHYWYSHIIGTDN